MTETRSFSQDDYIPMPYWGQDHWSTLAYVETVMVECQTFQIGRDPRMKSNRRNFRVMAQDCPNPKRPGDACSSLAMVMELAHSTKLNNGQSVTGHDDWASLQDMAAEGLFLQTPDATEPGVHLKLSPRGVEVVNALREHKRNGGRLADFRGLPLVEASAMVAS